MDGGTNWKKVALFTTGSVLLPPLQQWITCAQNPAAPCPFTAGTILLPAVPALVVTLAALFSNPRHRAK